MDVALNSEQELLQTTVERLADKFALVSPPPAAGGLDEECWSAIAHAGLLSLGGVDGPGTVLEAALVAEKLASRGCLAPYTGAVLAGSLAASAGADAALARRLSDGKLQLAVGLSADLTDLASVEDDSALAFDAAGAEAALVRHGGRLVAVSLEHSAESSIDLTRSVRRFVPDQSTLDIGDLGSTLDDEAKARWLAAALAILVGDLVGTMAGALDLAVEYAKGRTQFGVPIGSFQAIQHLLADQKVSLEASRTAMWYAAWSCDTASPAEALLASQAAKAFSSAAAREVTEACIQVHGGIAFTWECTAHIFLKRAMLSGVVLGDEHDQLKRLDEAGYGRSDGF
jgi:alkylation response protein AidB-like acyl-CoA dehydrogenase